MSLFPQTNSKHLMIPQEETSKQDEQIIESDNTITPFEWLTSSNSLKSILCPSLLFQTNEKRKALHLGCGSSTLGEYLVRELNYEKVVNVDVDKHVLDQMEARWKDITSLDDIERMEFSHVDLWSGTVPFPSGYFDLVVDKSTLDCTLCSEDASTGLLCEAYRSLNPVKGGVYVVISFNHVDLVLPLLRDLPGAEWTVEHKVIPRQVEDLVANKTNLYNISAAPSKEQIDVVVPPEDSAPSWTTGSFKSDEHYRKYINVFLCKRHGPTVVELSRDAVRAHIHKTNDTWFQIQNPMLTKARLNELRDVFDRSKGSNFTELELYDCIFSEEEREHLPYEYFLEDWEAFLVDHPDVVIEKMTFETAVQFLRVMQ